MPAIRTVAAYSTNTWISPVATLRIVGPLQATGIKLIEGNQANRINVGLVSASDLVLIQRDFPRKVSEFYAILERAHREEKPVVLDLDDQLLLLPENHPDRLNRYYEDALLPLARAIVEVDAVTTTNRVLKDYLSEFNSNTYVLPNYLDDQLWSFRAPTSRKGEIVIVYMGSPSHQPDLEMISPALERILSKYSGRVKLHILGMEPSSRLVTMPGIVSELAHTYDYSVFAQTFAQAQYEIAIAPLQDTFFNQCKSSVKFLEYSAAGIPGIYSRVAPYEEFVRHGKNGLLASSIDEWEENLILLIESFDLRLQLASAAQDTVRSDWLLSDHAKLWQDTYAEIQAGGQRSKERSPISQTILSITGDASKQLQENKEIQTELEQTRQKLSVAESNLREIYSSRGWKLVQNLWAIKLKLFPSKRQAVSNSMSVIESHSNFAGEIQYIGLDSKSLLDTKEHGEFDLFVFPVMNWETRTQRPQQLSNRFAERGYRVFYIRTSFNGDQPAQVYQLGKNMYELRLPGPTDLNLYHDNLPAPLQSSLLHIFSLLKDQLDIEKAISLVDLPFWAPLALDLRSSFRWPVVYDCMDYHKGFSTNATPMLNQERTLASQSDLVLATSHFLLQEMRAINPNCILVPNGTDFEHFGSRLIEIPQELVGFPHPIIGFYGAIADWFEASLIAALARSRPGWQFVLIGDTLYADLAPFASLPNVHLLGEKPYDDLPRYLHCFDVAIIPFKKTPLTDAMNTVKLFEYLSAGKPVVATDLDETKYYSKYVQIAANEDAWLAALESALHDNSPAVIQSRQEFASKNTWDQRVDLLVSAFEKLLI